MQTSPSGRKVNYPLLSDRTQKVSRMYRVLNEENGADYRATFIINPEGSIQSIMVNPQPVARNVDEILRIIQGLQYSESTGLRVPPGWEPGDKGIITGWEYIGRY